MEKEGAISDGMATASNDPLKRDQMPSTNAKPEGGQDGVANLKGLFGCHSYGSTCVVRL